MSYILDALKKSDRERPREGTALPLHEVPGFRLRPRRSRRFIAIAGISALVLCAGTGGAWIARSASEAQKAVAESTASVPISVQAVPSDRAALPASGPTVPVVGQASSGPAQSGSAQAQGPALSTGEASRVDVPDAPASATREGLLELWQLTEAEQKYLQGLDVSFHVHSNDPSKRAVIINGLRAKEGQSLGEDLRLAEIVPDGIVLEFQGQLVHLANPQPY